MFCKALYKYGFIIILLLLLIPLPDTPCTTQPTWFYHYYPAALLAIIHSQRCFNKYPALRTIITQSTLLYRSMIAIDINVHFISRIK